MNAKLTFSLSAAVVALFAATSISNAADAIFEPAPVAPPAPYVSQQTAASWEGVYGGAALGYGFSGETKVTSTSPDVKVGTDGFVGNVFGGWNGQSGSFVYGVEADVGYSGIDGTNAGYKSKSGVDGTLRARVGVAATDEVLVYATAGGAAARQKLSDANGSDTNTHLGWTAGVGSDIKLTDQAFGRIEYRYTDLNSKSYAVDGGVKADASNHKVLLGVGMKF